MSYMFLLFVNLFAGEGHKLSLGNPAIPLSPGEVSEKTIGV